MFSVFFLILSACAHNSVTEPPKLEKVTLSYPLKLEIVGEKGYTETARHFSYSIQKKYENGYISSEKHETVKFSVQTSIKNINPDQGLIDYEESTIEKIGMVDLNDLAFPELHETMQIILDKEGKVLKAGDNPPFSIFYLPPLPLPKKPIRVGDSWAYKGSWINPGQGIEFTVDLVMILKDTYLCLKNEICVDVAISGNVSLPEKAKKYMTFNSRIEGRVLYRPKTGSFLTSEIHNIEKLKVEKELIDSKSCIISKLKDLYPASEIENLKCEP